MSTTGGNTITLIARVDKFNADLRTATNGNNARFLCFVAAYKKKFPSGKYFTERFNILMFGKRAEEICPECTAGTLLMIVGEVGIDKPQEGAQDKGVMLKVVAQNIVVLDPSSSDEPESPQPEQPQRRQEPPPRRRETDGPPPF